MKKNLLFTLVLFLMSCAFASAQNYNEKEKDGLRAFLRQPSAIEGKLNLEQVGLAISDTTNWKTSEEWVKKISALQWHRDFIPHRLSSIFSWDGLGLAGNLDCSACEELYTLHVNGNNLTSLTLPPSTRLIQIRVSKNKLTSLDISKNINLISIDANENKLTSIDASKNTELERISLTQNVLTHINISNSEKLKVLLIENNQLASIDITKNINLRQLWIGSNQLTSIDLTKSKAMAELFIRGNKIEEIDLSACEVLRDFDCSYCPMKKLNLADKDLGRLKCNSCSLTSLDLTGFPKLSVLWCAGNELTELDISNNPNLSELWCYSNYFTELDITSNPSLKVLYAYDNYFKFSTIPLPSNPQLTHYKYWAYPIFHQSVSSNQIIDFSSEYIIDGKLTTYKWHDESNNEINLTKKGYGKFTVESAYEGQTLTCTMTNQSFPELVLKYQVKIVGAALQDHLQMNVNNNYVLSKDQQFKVFANVSGIDADDINFGLYTVADASFISDITVVSRKNSTYTCEVPSNTYNGSYMIVPYTYKDGKRVVINRAVATHFIDRLPLKVIDNEDDDIWGRSTKSYVSNQDITAQYMRANIGGKVNELLEVEQDASFMINIGTSSPESVRIGLFHLNGKFVTDITTKVNKSTYTCMVSGQPANTYLVMPYTKQNGVVEVIEREAKSGLMDRLPICVGEEDIWGRSAASFEAPATETNIIVYLNNTTNVVEIKGVDEVVNVEVYSLATGTLAKKAKVAASEGVSVQTLATGIYIVKVTTATGDTTSHKIKKD